MGDFGIVVVPRDGVDTEKIMNHSSILRKCKVRAWWIRADSPGTTVSCCGRLVRTRMQEQAGVNPSENSEIPKIMCNKCRAATWGVNGTDQQTRP